MSPCVLAYIFEKERGGKKKKCGKERSRVEVKAFNGTWGKFVVVRGNKEGHFFSTMPNVTLSYTLNREACTLPDVKGKRTHAKAAK